MERSSENNIEDHSVSNEKPIFDAVFQLGILKLCFTDDYVCSQLVRYLGDDKDLQKNIIFDTNEMHVCFQLLSKSFKQYGKRPSLGQVRQIAHIEGDTIKINRNDKSNKEAKVKTSEVLRTLEIIGEYDLVNDDFYKNHLTDFVKHVKLYKGAREYRKLLQEEPEKMIGFLQKIVDEINNISFEKNSIVTLDSIDEMIESSANSISQTIPTGIPTLDQDLHGGLPRQNLVTILAGTNVGKSMFTVALGKQALDAKLADGTNAGYKVLHIPLEGAANETPLRYISCLANIEYGKIINNSLSPEEKKFKTETVAKYKDRLLIHTGFLSFNTPIEKMMAECRDIYKRFKFDVLVVDYGQLLSTQVQLDGHRFVMAHVFRALSAMSREFDCVVISPAQATRNGQESQNQKGQFGQAQKDKLPVLRSEDISEAFEIARVSGIIISLNMTDEERNEKKLRVFLEKQRHGVKGKTYGLITDYSRCNLITKNFYDTISNVTRMSADDFDDKKTEAAFDIDAAIGKNADLNYLKNLDKLNNLALNINAYRTAIKKKADEIEEEKENNPFEIDDPNSIYAQLKSEVEKMDQTIRDDEKDYMKLFLGIFPTFEPAHLQAAETKLVKLQISGKKADEDEIVLVQKFIRIYTLAFSIKDY